jgi:hypothetical protein
LTWVPSVSLFKMELLTNATVVDDAIRFVQESKGKLKLVSSDKEEPKELHNDDQLEGKQENDTIDVRTTN